MEVVDIPPGYTHNITNTGETDLVTHRQPDFKFVQNTTEKTLLQPDSFFCFCIFWTEVIFAVY